MALFGAERFFTDGERDDRLEAAAVVGQRLAHLLLRTDGPGSSGRIGMPLDETPLSAVATTLLEGREAAQRGTTDELLASLAAGTLDAAIVFTPLGDRRVREALASGTLRLESVRVPSGAQTARTMPFLMDARIPAGAYPRTQGAVDTVGLQVVLAAVSRGYAAHSAAGGPATALPATGMPLSRSQVDRLSGASGAFQAPHPTLPSAWSPPPAPIDEPVFSSVRALDTSLNVFAIGFLLFVVAQTARPRRNTQSRPSTGRE